MTRLGYQIPNFTYPGLGPAEIFDNVVAHSSCDFHSPAHYDDPVVVQVRIAEMGGASFRFEFVFLHKRTHRLLASGESVHVAVDAKTMTPVELPEFFRKRIREYEGRSLGGSSPA